MYLYNKKKVKEGHFLFNLFTFSTLRSDCCSSITESDIYFGSETRTEKLEHEMLDRLLKRRLIDISSLMGSNGNLDWLLLEQRDSCYSCVVGGRGLRLPNNSLIHKNRKRVTAANGSFWFLQTNLHEHINKYLYMYILISKPNLGAKHNAIGCFTTMTAQCTMNVDASRSADFESVPNKRL